MRLRGFLSISVYAFRFGVFYSFYRLLLCSGGRRVKSFLKSLKYVYSGLQGLWIRLDD